jgi:hypothetical protein
VFNLDVSVREHLSESLKGLKYRREDFRAERFGVPICQRSFRTYLVRGKERFDIPLKSPDASLIFGPNEVRFSEVETLRTKRARSKLNVVGEANFDQRLIFERQNIKELVFHYPFCGGSTGLVRINS